jgi:two-component system chemotaxis response regulator CheY
MQEFNSPRTRKTVLVVEDDATMRELLGLHLQGAGYAVRTAADGLEAARACLGVIPDLIVSDLHMPKMDGFTLVEMLKSDARLADVPVIFLTVDEQGYSRGKELGAVAFLTKPILAEKLLSAVASALGTS